MDTKNWSVTTWVTVAVVVVVALFGAMYYMAPGDFKAKAAEIERLQQTLESKKAEARKAEAAVANFAEIQRETQALERKLAELKQILPTAPEMGDLLKWIKSLSDQTNLELQIFKPESITEQEFLREQPVSMGVIGNYHQLGLFFDRISKYARIINVENVRIGAQRDRTTKATIRADFVAKTYMYKDEPPKPAPQPKKRGAA